MALGCYQLLSQCRGHESALDRGRHAKILPENIGGVRSSSDPNLGSQALGMGGTEAIRILYPSKHYK